MKRIILLAAAILPTVSAFSQNWVEDSVFVTSYGKKIYYSLENGQVGDVPTNAHDLEFSTKGFSATIRLNNAGESGITTRLYAVAGDTTTFTAVWDTTGMADGSNAQFVRCLDADSLWEQSAFEFGATGHPDYGWGTYNSQTHNVIGKKVFLFKTRTGAWKRVWIRNLMSAAGTYNIRIADFDGSNVEDISVNKSGLTSKAFLYYNFDTNTTSNPEPDKNTYDLVFGRYINANPNDNVYGLAVTGVLLNDGVKAVEVKGLPAEDADYLDYTLSDNISAIGDKYKALDYVTYQWYVYDSTSYFISDVNQNIWQIKFTKFGGTTTGLNKFMKRQVGFASVEEYQTIPSIAVFPNPATENVNLVYTSTENSNMSVQIIDLAGRTVYAQNFASNAGLNNINLNLSQISNGGMYILRMTDGKTVRTEKIMIQR